MTVSGLLGGAEVLEALRERALGERVYLPRAMFAQPPQGPPLSGGEAGELCTLDDLTVGDFQRELGRPVVLAEFLSELCVPPLNPPRTAHGGEEEAASLSSLHTGHGGDAFLPPPRDLYGGDRGGAGQR